MGNRWRNWGGNVACEPAAVEEPESLLEVREAIGRAATAGQRVKVVGAGHSFSGLAGTEGRLLRLDRLDRILAVDPSGGRAVVEGGIPLWKLNEGLAVRGLALGNLGDIDRQSIAGATATATHGTSLRYGGLAVAIRGLELVTADSEVVWCSADEEPEVFHCARVGLGALGVVTKVELECEPAFRLHAEEKPRRWDDFVAEWPGLVAANDHVDAYWFPHTDICTAKVSNRTDEPVRTRSEWKRWRDEVLLANYVFGAGVELGKLVPALVPRIAEAVAGSIGRIEAVDRSDRVYCSRRLVRFVEMEYSIPLDSCIEALGAIRELIDREGLRVAFPVEIRALVGDDIPLSTAYGAPRAYLAVHLPAGIPYDAYFGGVEAIMNRFAGRPHWGKLHFQDSTTLAPRYPEWDRFQAVRARLDPHGRFANEELDRVLGPVA